MTARSDYASAEISWLTSAIWQSKFLFAFVFLSLFCAVVALVLYVTPMYEGTALLFVNHSGVTQRSQEAKNDLQEDGSLAQMAESEEVLSEAISRIGLSELNASLEQPGPSKVEELRRWLLPNLYHADLAMGPMQAALVPVHRSLNVRVEPNSDIIRISFRNRDPAVAARFANAVAQAFIERQIAIFDNPGAADFFKRRKTEFENTFRNLSDELTSYAVANSAYSIDDQRQLLLKTQSELAMALNTTRNQLADRLAQRQVLASELRRLAPVARSSYVSSLVDALGGPTQQTKEQDRSSVEDRTSDPPLLLVRVYQDTMATLFKINSDVTATRSVEAEQVKQLAAVGAQLDSLQKHEKRFSELRTAVSQASYNVEFYTRKMVEEQVRSELARERFSPLKLLQAATVSSRPVFPNYWLALAFALLASSAGATAATCAWHAHRERRGLRRPASSQLLPSPI